MFVVKNWNIFGQKILWLHYFGDGKCVGAKLLPVWKSVCNYESCVANEQILDIFKINFINFNSDINDVFEKICRENNRSRINISIRRSTWASDKTYFKFYYSCDH